jgi:hypothetical protein
MVGSQDNAIRILRETEKNLIDGVYRYSGFVTPDNNGKNGIHKLIPKLRSLDNLEKIIDSNDIRLVVLAWKSMSNHYCKRSSLFEMVKEIVHS